MSRSRDEQGRQNTLDKGTAGQAKQVKPAGTDQRAQQEVRLLLGTRYSVSQVEIGQVGGSLVEAIPSDNHQKNLQLHSSGSTGGKSGTGSVTFHEQGGGSDQSDKNELLRYFRLVSVGLTEFLRGDRVPLVLAGVEYLLPIYKEANTYSNTMDTVIKGSPDLMSADELHKSANLRPAEGAEALYAFYGRPFAEQPPVYRGTRATRPSKPMSGQN